MISRLLTILVAGLALSLPSLAVETLRVLTWPGYVDSDLVKAFEKKFDVRVEVSFVSSDEVLREKIGANQGGHFDVFAANTVEMQHSRHHTARRDLCRALHLFGDGPDLRPQAVRASSHLAVRAVGPEVPGAGAGF